MKQDTKKSQPVSKEQVWFAYCQVRRNGKAAGVDGVSLKAYEEDKVDFLYKLWNRMASGSYFPPPVRRINIPKTGGGKRPIGIPTVSDRIAQKVVKNALEPILEPLFHRNSFGYRPHHRAQEAVLQCKEQCWDKPWVIDLDIKGFFDNLDHDLLLKAVRKHTQERWILLYIDRWLNAPIQQEGGELVKPTRGTPQGGVISPLLANLFLHYAFDRWMEIHFQEIVFERYADDIVVHCVTLKQAEYLLNRIRKRLKSCKLELHPEKTKIVYCKHTQRKERYDQVKFDFLGFTFKPRKAKNRKMGGFFIGFGPGISSEAAKKINRELRQLTIHRRIGNELQDIARILDQKLRGWIQYYGRINLDSLRWLMFKVNDRITRWVRKRFKRFKYSWYKARSWLKSIYRSYPNLFVHWQYGFKP